MVNATVALILVVVVAILLLILILASKQQTRAVSVRVRARAERPPGKQNPDTLLKKATANKKAGDIEGAIQALKEAYSLIGADVTQYPVATFLRLPLYLQNAGRPDEAWREFNNLLTVGYPNQPSDKKSVASDRVQIYTKMRLFLQREGRCLQAVKFGAYSLFLQGQAGYRATREEVDDTVGKLMCKAKKPAQTREVAGIVWQAIRTPQKTGMQELGRRLDACLNSDSRYGRRDRSG